MARIKQNNNNNHSNIPESIAKFVGDGAYAIVSFLWRNTRKLVSSSVVGKSTPEMTSPLDYVTEGIRSLREHACTYEYISLDL